MFSVIYFLCYMLWFFLRKDEWGTLPMSEQMSLWAIIVVGLIVGVCVRVFWQEKRGEVLFNAFKTIEIVSQQRYNK